MLNFKEFIQQQINEFNNDYAKGAIISSEKQHPISGDPLLHLIVPKIEKTARIEFVDRNSKSHNKLITILLSDNTKLFLNWDEFRRIQGSEPVRGKTLNIVFQRHPDDHSNTPSKIISATCY